MNPVYLDHNATTPLDPRVRAHLDELLDLELGNPSSVHAPGRRARQLIDLARQRAAAALRVGEHELVFTSGGSESDALGVLGPLRALGPRAGLVTSAVEHSAVLNLVPHVRAEGREARVLGVDASGSVDPSDCARALAQLPRSVLSLQAANNEIGTVQPLAACARACEALPREQRPIFHTDAVQALGKIGLCLDEWRVDLASFSVHKLGGPIGVGLLYCRAGTPIQPLAGASAQEGGLRAGTEPAALISAAALAIELAVAEQREYARRTRALALELWNALRARFDALVLHGPALDSPQRLPNTLNVGFGNADGKMLALRLDLAALCVSAGSACASGSIEASHVLLALGLDAERARAGLRISLGRNTTEQDCKRAVDILSKTISA